MRACCCAIFFGVFVVCVIWSGFGVEYVLDGCGCDGWLGFLGFVLECLVDLCVDCVGVDEVVDGGGLCLSYAVDSGAGLVVFGGCPWCFDEEHVV